MTVIQPVKPAQDAGADTKSGQSIPLATPNLGGNEWAYVKECLDSGWVSSVGAFVERFESDFAAYLGAQHAVAAVNGTAALHVALLVAGVRPNDEVLMPSFTFVAPANAVRYAGAWPVFVDAESATWQMDVAQVRAFLDTQCDWSDGVVRNRQSGRRIGAILPVHVLGHPVDMDPLLELAREYQVPVVEDAAESLGAAYKGTPLGRSRRLAAFSFNGNKVMTTGGGGMIVTDDPALAERARYLTTTAKDDAVEGIHGCVGFNYRLTNLQAAMGCAQLEQLDGFLETKRRIAARYAEGLSGIAGLGVMPQADWAQSAYWLYSVRIDELEAACDARALRGRLRARGIDTRTFWQPMHLSPAHVGAQALGGTVAESLFNEVLSLPCSTDLDEAGQAAVIAAIRDNLTA